MEPARSTVLSCLVNALGILSIPGREGGGRSDESEERPRAFSSLVVTVLAGSQLLGRSGVLFLFCSGSVALNLALLTGSVWRSHDRHYTQEYSFHFLSINLIHVGT